MKKIAHAIEKFAKRWKHDKWFFIAIFFMGGLVVSFAFWMGRKNGNISKNNGYESVDIDSLMDHKMSLTTEKVAKHLIKKLRTEKMMFRLIEEIRNVFGDRELRVSGNENKKQFSKRKGNQSSIYDSSMNVDLMDELVREEVIRQLKGDKMD